MDKEEMREKFQTQEQIIKGLKNRVVLLEEDCKDVHHLKQRYIDMKASFKRVNQELIDVYASKRWKLTEPLAKLRRKSVVANTEISEFKEEQELKKTIFIIDQYVPKYDQDAGSRSVYSYIRLFLDMGWHIVFMGDDFDAPQPYTSELEQLGVEVLSGEYYKDNWRHWVIEHADEIDVAFINRPSIARKFLFFIKETTKAKIIYFGHDLHFLRERREAEVKQDADGLERAGYTYAVENVVMEDADIVMMFNQKEKEIIQKEFGLNVLTVPLFFYSSFEQAKKEFKSTRDLLFVGGFKHTPNVDGILWFMKEVFPRIKEKNPEMKIYIAGSHPPEQIKALEADDIVVTGFVSDEKLNELYQECRVCVIPLRFGAGVKGKTLEAMYYGISIVSTSIGIEGMEKIEDVITPADTAEEFSRQVVEKYTNIDVLKQDCEKYQEYLKQYNSYTHTRDLFEKVFKTLGV